jgi:kynurenine 3-monooxygenase
VEDPRGKSEAITNLRSINLAISARGLEALRSVDPSLGKFELMIALALLVWTADWCFHPAEQFLEEAIPMKGRMIHHVDGKQDSQIYDPIHLQVSFNDSHRPSKNRHRHHSMFYPD